MKKLIAMTALIAVMGACSPQDEGAGSTIMPAVDVVPETWTGTLHDRLTVLDSHLDTPSYFHSENYDFSKRQTFQADGTHVDLPRMNEGGLDGGFWVIFIPQGPLDPASYEAARNAGLMRQTAIRELAAKYSDDVELAFTADDVERIVNEGKKVVFQSMENSYPLGEDLSLMETFYVGGLRMIAPVHFRNNQFADSSSDVTTVFEGLSPLGEELVREANRLGMVLDGSHASDDTVWDMLELSTTPIILSHSLPRAMYDHPRNVSDELLLAIAEDGGVIQMNIYSTYLEALEPSPERQAARAELIAEFGTNFSALSTERKAAYREAWRQININFPPPRSSFEKFKEHLFYTLDLVGPDHVGISGDWDGGGGVDGMQDVADLPRITEALVKAGYSEEDIAKIWGGNMLRLLRAAEAARSADLQSPNVLN